MTGSGAQTSSQVLGEFVAKTETESIPAEVIEHAKVCLLDTIGCGLYGSTLPQSSIVREMLLAAGGGGCCGAGAGGCLAAGDCDCGGRY